MERPRARRPGWRGRGATVGQVEGPWGRRPGGGLWSHMGRVEGPWGHVGQGGEAVGLCGPEGGGLWRHMGPGAGSSETMTS